MTARFVCAAFAEQGARPAVNDSYGWSKTAAFVADSAGASGDARRVADAAVEHFARLAAEGDLASALVDAAEAFGDVLPADSTGMTTVAGAVVDARGLMWTVSQGDSLVAHLRDGAVLSVSSLHNAAHELTLLGRAATYGTSAVLSRYLSATSAGAPEVRVSRARQGDVVVLLTDGASAHLTVGEVVRLVSTQTDAGAIARSLHTALLARAELPADNATCVVAVVDGDSAEGERV